MLKSGDGECLFASRLWAEMRTKNHEQTRHMTALGEILQKQYCTDWSGASCFYVWLKPSNKNQHEKNKKKHHSEHDRKVFFLQILTEGMLHKRWGISWWVGVCQAKTVRNAWRTAGWILTLAWPTAALSGLSTDTRMPQILHMSGNQDEERREALMLRKWDLAKYHLFFFYLWRLIYLENQLKKKNKESFTSAPCGFP